MNLDPDLARQVSDCARQITVTKSLIERAKSFDERQILEQQLTQHETEMQRVQLIVRNSWGT